MTQDKEKLIVELVNKGLDGDMDSVNNHEDKIVRAKAKAMIMKVKKGTVERPPMPETASDQPAAEQPKSLTKDETVAMLVNKGLDGDMDSVNNHEDKIVRAKAKAMIMKVKKGTVERPPIPEISNQVTTDPINDNQDQAIKIEDPFEKVKKVITEKFSNDLDEGKEADCIYFKPDNWLEIAKWLRSEPSLLFDSLQCQMGMDMGEDILESRYNFHSMELDHYLEVRIRVSRSDPKIPSVEQVWRIADWFERET